MPNLSSFRGKSLFCTANPLVAGIAFLVASLGVAGSLSLFWETPFFGTAVFVSIAAVLALDNLNRARHGSRAVLSIITIVQFCLLVTQAKFRLLPLGGEDWRGYNRHATDILTSPNNFLSTLLHSDENLFSKLLATVYWVFGEYLQFGYFMVFVTALLGVNAMIRIADALQLDDRHAKLLVVIFAAWPINFVFSVTLLREMPIQACIAWATYLLVLSLKRGRWRYLAGSAIFALIAALLHSALIVFVAGILVLIGVFDIRSKVWGLSLDRLTLAGGIAAAFVASPLYGASMAKFGEGDLDTVIDRAGYAAGDTAYVTSAPTSVTDMILSSPSRLIMFLSSPMPWQARGLPDIIGVLASSLPTVVVTVMLIILVRRIRILAPDERVIVIVTLVIVLVAALVLAWGTGNYGTAMRHRVKILPVAATALVILLQAVYEGGKKYAAVRHRASI